MKDYLLHFMEDLDYPEEAKAPLLKGFDAVMAHPTARERFCALITPYEEHDALDREVIFAETPEIAEESGVHRYTVELLLFMCFSKHLLALYEKNGIDARIWRDTVSDLKYKLLECMAVKGIYGSFVAQWFTGFFDLTRFTLGRLQFELIEYKHPDYTKNGKTVQKGMKVINVHIPRTLTPLDQESCDTAFAMAETFFEKALGDTPVAFVCSSWLLYPAYTPILAEGSNVKKFAARFDIVSATDDAEGTYPDMWRLFDMDYTGSIEDYPEDSSLRRTIKKYLKAGGKTGCGYGIFLA